MIVAIDGPAGAGKSTVARRLADRIGAQFLNTGAMYRALTLHALRMAVDPADADGLTRLAQGSPVELGERRVCIGGIDVTHELGQEDVTRAVSAVSAHAGVREAMVARQREIAAVGDWVCEGRDMGSVVFPDAALKIFLTARPEVRAARRNAELTAGGFDDDPAAVLADIVSRDARDSTRAVSPLVVAPGAVVVDTSDLDLEQVVEGLVALVGGARG